MTFYFSGKERNLPSYSLSQLPSLPLISLFNYPFISNTAEARAVSLLNVVVTHNAKSVFASGNEETFNLVCRVCVPELALSPTAIMSERAMRPQDVSTFGKNNTQL